MDFFGKDPYGLPRTKNVGGSYYWDAGQAIDAVKAAGFGPDVVFGWGTTANRIQNALKGCGLDAAESFKPGPFVQLDLPIPFESAWARLQTALAADTPVPVLIDLEGFMFHWAVAYKIASGKIYLGNCPWNPSPTKEQFRLMWLCRGLPWGFNYAAVYAKPWPGSGWQDIAPNPITSTPAVTSSQPGQLDVFARGSDDALWYKRFDGQWHAWEQLSPSKITSAPAAIAKGDGSLDVFARGTDSGLWHKQFDGQWHDWELLSAIPIASGPAAAYSPDLHAVRVVAQGEDHTLRQMEWYAAAGRWYPWLRWDQGSQITSAPAICWRQKGFSYDVFARGTDGALWHTADDHHQWEQLGTNIITSAPAAVWSNNETYVFVRGTDNALWHRRFHYDNGTWSDYELLGATPMDSAPSAVARPGTVDVFARSPSFGLWHKWFDGQWNPAH
jgi:hypothetical protein